jgi:choline dehydrogenase-like flavoprotein
MFKRQASLIGFNVMAEQQPNPDSRVTLSDKTDRLGVPRVSLDWRITDFDRYSMRRSLQIVARTMERSKLGRIVWILGDESPPVLIRGGWHHMGTTRMHRDSRMGVVDDNCRVHGCENLFVAGSSVFPTGGASNPTLTIVALALRLAKHIEHLG